MRINSGSPFKKCPRCRVRCLVHEKKCHECGLIFERLNYVSNKTAKKNLLKGKRNEVLMVSTWPYDAKKFTALLLCGFLGFSGAHNFYLGRFIKGFLMLLGLLLALTLVILFDLGFSSTAGIAYYFRIIGFIPCSSVLIFWISDFISIFLERYKIPVSIDNKLYDIKPDILEDSKNKDKKTKLTKTKK